VNEDDAKSLAEKVTTENKATALADLAKLVVQAQVMIRGLPKVVEAMDEIIEKLRTPPRLQEFIEKSFKEQMQDAPWYEGDAWKGDTDTRILKGASQAQEWINKMFKEKMTEVSSIRAMARTQIALAKGFQNIGMLVLALGHQAELPSDVSALLKLLTEQDLSQDPD